VRVRACALDTKTAVGTGKREPRPRTHTVIRVTIRDGREGSCENQVAV
jgi:hypothetical protein